MVIDADWLMCEVSRDLTSGLNKMHNFVHVFILYYRMIIIIIIKFPCILFGHFWYITHKLLVN